MSLLNIFHRPTPATIDVVALDASLHEVHRSQSQPTDNPVEQGAPITDHIRQQPDELEITGLVTNSPINVAGGRDPARAQEAYDALRKLQAEGTLVTVATSLRQYDDLAITKIEVDRTASTGDVALLAIGLRQIKVVTTASVQVDPKSLRARAAKPVNRGNVHVKKLPTDHPKGKRIALTVQGLKAIGVIH